MGCGCQTGSALGVARVTTATCPECQTKIDFENEKVYLRELQQWIVESLSAIAAQTGTKLSSPPFPPQSNE